MVDAREEPVSRQIGEDDATTTRIGAVALPLAIIVFVVATAIHPSGEVMNNPVIFRVYAQSESWIAVHFAQWVGVLLLISQSSQTHAAIFIITVHLHLSLTWELA